MIIFSKPPVYEKFDVKNPDLDKLVKQACPPFDMAYPGSIADNFGFFYFGIGDGFRYSPKENVNNETKWKYVALCALYWMTFYENLYHESEYKKYKQYLKEVSEKNPEFLNTLKHLEELEDKKYE